MRLIRKSWPLISVLLVFGLLAASFGGAIAAQPSDSTSQAVPAAPAPQSSGMLVARVYYRDTADLNQLASQLDVWEVSHAEQYVVAMLSSYRYSQLSAAGYRLEVDAIKTALLSQPNIPLPGQVN